MSSFFWSRALVAKAVGGLWFSAVGYRRLSRYYLRASAFVDAVLGALEAAAPLQSAKKARIMQRAIWSVQSTT